MITRGNVSNLSTAGGSAVAIAWPSNPSVGQKVIMTLWTGSNNVPTSLVDNGVIPSVFTLAESESNGADWCGIYYADNITLPASGQYTVTVNNPNRHGIYGGGRAYSGVMPGPPTGANAGSGTGSSVASGSATPTAAGGLGVAVFADSSGENPETQTLTGSGFSTLLHETNGSGFWAGASADNVAASGATDCTWTLDDSVAWVAAIAVWDAQPAPIGAPSLTLTITPPGGSPSQYQDYLTYQGHQQQMMITQNFGRQGDTCTLPLVDEYETTPNLRIPVMSQVELYDNNCDQVIFAGVINDPTLVVTGPNRNEWTLQCTDYTYYADNAIVHGIYYGWSVDDIVVDLVKQADCGISAAEIADGGFVAPGPQLASFVLNYDTLSNAWRKLASLAGIVTPYGWYVDQNRQLHFYDATTALPSGVTFTTEPTVGGSITEGHILNDGQNSYEWDGTQIRNRILVQGANQTITNLGPLYQGPTDTWRADGTQSSWPLRYTLTGSPTLWINGLLTTLTVVTGGGSSSGAWVAEQNSVGQWFLHAANPPGAGTLIQIWYNYQIPVVAQANDRASQIEYTGPNGGVFSMYVSDTSLFTAPMALARAMQQRTEYAFAPERFMFNTGEEFLGWVRAGQTCTIDNGFIPDSERSWQVGINDDFIVVANQVTFTKAGYRQQNVTAVRL